METAKKPEIKSTTATVKCHRYGELIKKEKEALPRLTEEIKKIRHAKKQSYISMISNRRKIKRIVK
ncbi:MAG: hypothetical protein IJH39_08555 [Clostridia bacterium]|nr:hypothetical protein [Clostridia bacterium]